MSRRGRDLGERAWLPRLEVSTGIAHLAAPVKWALSGQPDMTIIGYQTRCRGSYLVHDEYVIDTIPSDAPLAVRVTCIECLAAET